LSGLFGVGGGVAIVPLLTAWCGQDQRQAVATSLMALGPLAVFGVIGYAVHGAVDLWLSVPLAVGSMIGAWLGAGLLDKLSPRVLRWLFTTVLTLVAVRMVLVPGGQAVPVSHAVWCLVLLVPAGMMIGLLAALTGIGGGAVAVPLLQLGYGAAAATAKGSSLLMILPASISGGWRNLRLGNGSRSAAGWIGGAGAGAALATSQLSVRLDPVLADRLFALLLIGVAVRTVWNDLVTLLRR
jgi:uncharacterized membrane protein YfcA